MSPFRPEGPSPPLRCRRFAYGYALDGSECPSYLVWPQRDGQSYTLLDTSTADTLVLDQNFFRPLGMQHFYDSFALVSQICVRRDALALFGLREDELLYLTCTLPEMGCCVLGLVLIKNIGSTMKHGQRTEQKSLQRLSSWQPMRWTRSLPRLSRMVIPVTRKGVKVRVTLSRMTLPLRLQLMQNSMSSCKFRMLRWARTFMTMKISLGRSTASFRNWSWFLRDGLWRGYLFLYKNVWTTLTEYWLGVAGKFKQHV